MRKYLIRRILYMIPVMLGITLVTFCLFYLAGGDPALIKAGKNATPERIAEVRTEMGLNKPLPIQFLNYVKQVATFDFGRSWTSQEKITTMVFGNSLETSPLLISLSLTLPGFLITVILSITISLMLTFSHLHK